MEPGIPTSDDRTMAMLCHLSALLGGIIAPLLVWLLLREGRPFLDDQGKEAVNFNLSFMLYYLVAAIVIFPLCFVFIGFLLLPLLFVMPIVFVVMVIVGAMKANEGIAYRYPMCIRFFT